MAMLASKTSFPAPPSGTSQPSSSQYSNIANYRIHGSAKETNGFFASPTESEFSESTTRHDVPQDAIKNWGEHKVADWIRAIEGCAPYAELFKRNNINGENLLEMDATHLKEMGIKKMGHRLRISTEVKILRNKQFKKATLQKTNTDSLALLDSVTLSPPSSASPRPFQVGRTDRPSKRMSRQITGSDLSYASTLAHIPSKSSSRPASPFVEQDQPKSGRSQYLAEPSPKRDGYVAHPTSASTGTGRAPLTPSETPQAARFAHHVKQSMSQDAVTNSMVLPADKALIRVIFPDGRTTVLSIDGCRTAEDVIRRTLRKGSLNEAQVKNHCFYVLDGVDPNPVYCRRLGDSELVRVMNNRAGLERGRLIFRKIHAGEPDEEQLRQAANIASQQQLQQTQHVFVPTSNRSQLKIEKITGESLAAVSYPLSPGSAKERERHINMTGQNLERPDSGRSNTSQRIKRIKELHGGRPPSELIASDLSTYFPDFEKGEIDKRVRLSIRRSKRISRAASRLSTVSNMSAQSLKDGPPLPSISDAWLNNGQLGRNPRPLSVVRLGASANGSFRDSFASSMLEPLDEESPLEPNRKSYASFDEADSISMTDPDGHTTMQSYYDDDGRSSAAASSMRRNSSLSSAGFTEAGDSLNMRLSQIVNEDSEESDEELSEYLEQDSWENVQYMKGALIGQGSFGSVYLALHSVTGELMAVKQVEMPSSSGTQLDAKKNNMVEALKHEIGLLRDLKHPNIVQYLGSNSDDTHLNIFLEYVPGGSVATMLVNYGPLNEGLITNFVRQILNGLAYLHSRDIIHRDIKGANILVDNKGAVKISDFGISKRVEASSLLNSAGLPSARGKPTGAVGPRVSLQGSVFWMAPEVVKQTAYTRKADIWSLGCLIVEMHTGHHPHPNCTQLQAIFKIGGSGDASPTVPDAAGDEVKEFLARTFEIDHEKRPTAEELLQMRLCAAKA